MSLSASATPVRGRDIQVQTWADADLATLTTTVNTALKAMGEVRVLELTIRFSVTTYFAVAVTTTQG